MTTTSYLAARNRTNAPPEYRRLSAGRLYRIAVLAAGASVMGCAPPPSVVEPITTTPEIVRPPSTIHVQGADGQPIQGARVVVMTAYLAPNELVWTLSTDRNGHAAIPADAITAPVPSGQVRQWLWCVEHGGYIPVAGARADVQSMAYVKVQLIRGYASFRCNPSTRFSDVGTWQERAANTRDSGNLPEQRTATRTQDLTASMGERSTTRPFGAPAGSGPRIHVISLANQSRGVREVSISIADASAEHALVLLSGYPVRWKLEITQGTTVRSVLFYSANKRADNSVISGLPPDLTPLEARLPMPIRRYRYGEGHGRIELGNDYVALGEMLLARFGSTIATFQSGVAQTSFMIR